MTKPAFTTADLDAARREFADLRRRYIDAAQAVDSFHYEPVPRYTTAEANRRIHEYTYGDVAPSAMTAHDWLNAVREILHAELDCLDALRLTQQEVPC